MVFYEINPCLSLSCSYCPVVRLRRQLLNKHYMAEDEIVKHTKKIYKIWSSHEHNFWHKLKEFLLEVVIIVFAVSLSIWFHNRSEHAGQQEDVKQFMLGLKSDLQSDLEEMRVDKQTYLRQKAAFTYIANVKLHQSLNEDSLDKYDNSIFTETALSPNNGRFEGFKSSGKIGQIENKQLQNDIMDLYQEDIVTLLASANGYINIKRELFGFIDRNRKRLTDSTTNMKSVLAMDEAQNICIKLRRPNQVLERYDKCMAKMEQIITEINNQYNLKD